jgi:hypothetical protein
LVGEEVAPPLAESKRLCSRAPVMLSAWPICTGEVIGKSSGIQSVAAPRPSSKPAAMVGVICPPASSTRPLAVRVAVKP